MVFEVHLEWYIDRHPIILGNIRRSDWSASAAPHRLHSWLKGNRCCINLHSDQKIRDTPMQPGNRTGTGPVMKERLKWHPNVASPQHVTQNPHNVWLLIITPLYNTKTSPQILWHCHITQMGDLQVTSRCVTQNVTSRYVTQNVASRCVVMIKWPEVF
jgi:hypothetical protein